MSGGVDMDNIPILKVASYLEEEDMRPFYEEVQRLLTEYNTILLDFQDVILSPAQLFRGFFLFFYNYGPKAYKRCFIMKHLDDYSRGMMDAFAYYICEVAFVTEFDGERPSSSLLRSWFDGRKQMEHFFGVSYRSIEKWSQRKMGLPLHALEKLVTLEMFHPMKPFRAERPYKALHPDVFLTSMAILPRKQRKDFSKMIQKISKKKLM